MQKVHRHFIF